MEANSRQLDGPSYVEVTDVRGFKALVLIPSNNSEAINGKLPTILFLHGIGESGNDLDLLKQNGFPKMLEGDQQFPFIFIMPQCPSNTEWYYTNVDNVKAMSVFLDDMISRYPIDTARLYITGLSMGGIGSWYFAINMPTRFAALVPVAFRGDGWAPDPAKGIPVWAFHGAKDAVIPLTNAQELVDQFEAAGGSIRFTIYPNGAHDSSTWTVAYSNRDLYDWMLRYKKEESPTNVHVSREFVKTEFLLDQNFPNPFNPTTTIGFNLSEAGYVTLEVYNLLGQRVGTLLDRQMPAGTFRLPFNATGLPSGTYIYRIRTSGYTENRVMLLLR